MTAVLVVGIIERNVVISVGAEKGGSAVSAISLPPYPPALILQLPYTNLQITIQLLSIYILVSC